MVHKFFIELPDVLKVCGPVVDRQSIPDDIMVSLRWVIPETPVDDGDDAGIRFISDQAADACLRWMIISGTLTPSGIIRNRRLIVNDRIGYEER